MAGVPLRFPWETTFFARVRSGVPHPSELARVPAPPGMSRGGVVARRVSEASVPASTKREGLLGEWASLLGSFLESEISRQVVRDRERGEGLLTVTDAFAVKSTA
eukprot:6446339-Amphidinium_carterae.1